MFNFIYNKYNQLFCKNLFERLVIYILLSLLFAKLYSEGVLGQEIYYNPRIAQWIFYLLLATDYIVNIKKIVTMKIQFNAMSVFAMSLFPMLAHGLIVGIYNDNPWFLIFNDTIPFLTIAINIFRMQSSTENETPIDFQFLFRFCGFTSVCSVLFSFLLQKAGFILEATLKVEAVYLCVFFAALLTQYKLRYRDIFYFIIVMSFAITQMNRTTLVFIAIVAGIICIKSLLRNPIRGAIIALVSVSVIIIGFYSLPKDSATYKRIIDSQNIDLSKRTGSVGERQQERDSVNLELYKRSPTDELVGMGMGGTYTMKFTHETVKEYGHAHYSWVWFKMRFGQIGYVYLGILTLALILNCIRNITLYTPLSISISLLCFSSMLYLFTYVNSIFLLSGLTFLYLNNEKKRKILGY